MSFTMMELVVAMLISSIVISIVFYAFYLVKGRLEVRRSEAAATMEYVLLQRAIRRDFERAFRIDDPADTAGILLHTDGHDIRYAIDTVRITRSMDGITDTFTLGGKVGVVAYVSDSLRLVRSLEIGVKVNGERVSLQVDKQYTAVELMAAENSKYE